MPSEATEKPHATQVKNFKALGVFSIAVQVSRLYKKTDSTIMQDMHIPARFDKAAAAGPLPDQQSLLVVVHAQPVICKPVDTGDFESA